MEKLVLEYLGDDFLGMPVYKDKNGSLLKDINYGDGEPSLHTVLGDSDGDPDVNISRIKKYKDLEIVIIGKEDKPDPSESFNYQMLSRLQSDCEYFLYSGCGSERNLWAHSVASQIKEMKTIYSSFQEAKKPEWISLEDILEYEKLMKKKLLEA